ncbi:MAG: glutaredoxin family protein [Acidimicrobiia bacterium]
MNDFSLTFVTRHGCHLCEDAFAVVTRVSRGLGVPIRVVQIEDDDELVRLYSFRIPVLLGPRGEVLAESAMAERPLRKVIRSARRSARRRSV